jgi:hypothetical protein
LWRKGQLQRSFLAKEGWEGSNPQSDARHAVKNSSHRSSSRWLAGQSFDGQCQSVTRFTRLDSEWVNEPRGSTHCCFTIKDYNYHHHYIIMCDLSSVQRVSIFCTSKFFTY